MTLRRLAFAARARLTSVAPGRFALAAPAPLASAALALLAITSCASPAPAPPGEAVDLLACPPGDGEWRSAIGKSGGEADLARLETIARDAAARCPERWEPRWAAGETLFRRSKYVEAREPFEEALSRARQAGDATGIACAANRIGSLQYFRGETEPARASFEKALAAARRADRDDLRAFVLNNLAGLLKEKGELTAAAVLFDEAVETLRGLGLAKQARAAAYNAAVLRSTLGDLGGAREVLEALRKDAEAAGDAEVTATASIALGNLLLTAGDLAGARAWYERVTAETGQVALSRELALGRLALAGGDLAEAARRLGAAERIGREKGLVLDTLYAETWRADVEIREGRPRQALTRLARIEAEAKKADSTEYVLWLARWQSGRAFRAAGDDGRARAAFRESVDFLESQTAALSLEQEGLHFLVGRSDPYTDLADALVRRDAKTAMDGGADEVLDAMERAHARRLRRAFGADGPRSAPVRIEAIRASLAPGDVFLDYLMGRDRGVVLVVTRHEARAVAIGGWNAIATPLARWRAAVVRPIAGSLAAVVRPEDDLARDADAGHALRRALIDPLGRALDGARRVWVVPDGELALLPLAALPAAPRAGAAARVLGEDLEFGTLPMAGAIPRRAPVTGRLLVAGNPSGGNAEFGPLVRASAEMDGVAAAWPAGATVRLDGDRFLREAFVGLPLESFATLHLATHAVASSVDPRRCAVVFSRGGMLGFDAIARLKLGRSLVVLSACRSGEGEVIPGQGVVGLGWAFLAAGARALVVSLWSVDDAAAAELMVAFHARLRAGDDPVRALSSAQAKMRGERRHPAYWAPFIVVSRPGL